jgi:uncharacterized protein (DUF362 family)
MNRRTFLKSAAIAGAGTALFSSRSAQAAAPALAIARYKSSPAAPDGIAEEARRLTRAGIDALGGMGRFVSKGQTVWIKPNISWDRRPEQAATTNPDVVATLVELCYQAGAKRVLLSDNPCNSAQRTFPRSGIQQAAEKAGAQVFFMDERKFRKMALNGKVLKEWPVYAQVVEADVLINVPIAKHHSLTTVTLGMKNLMGAVGGARERFHQNTELTLPDLAAFLKPKLIVLDAIRVLMGNGPVGGSLTDVKRKETVVAGTDQVAVDAYGATLLGHKPQAIEHIVEAGRRGLGNINFEALSPKIIEV